MNIIETAWKWNSNLVKRPRTDYIALHHAQALKCSAADIDAWHKDNGWSGIGYHFFVRKDGTIYRGRPVWAMGAHVSGMNNCSIGICAEGSYDKEKVMPYEQKKAIKEVIRLLKQEYPNAKIVGHKEIGSSDCPGKYYPLDEMKKYYMESEDLTMSQYEELMQKINAINEKQSVQYSIISAIGDEINLNTMRIKNLECPDMVYNYIDNNMPEWAREGVEWCVNKGILKGTGTGLGLNDDKLWLCTVIHRTAEVLAKMMGVRI